MKPIQTFALAMCCDHECELSQNTEQQLLLSYLSEKRDWFLAHGLGVPYVCSDYLLKRFFSSLEEREIGTVRISAGARIKTENMPIKHSVGCLEVADIQQTGGFIRPKVSFIVPSPFFLLSLLNSKRQITCTDTF